MEHKLNLKYNTIKFLKEQEKIYVNIYVTMSLHSYLLFYNFAGVGFHFAPSQSLFPHVPCPF